MDKNLILVTWLGSGAAHSAEFRD